MITTIDRYEILKKIGEGGMGVVYLAKHTTLDRLVALKILHAHLAQDEALRKRFHNEAKVMAKLIHPNIVQLFDYLEVDGKLVLVMEYVDGRTLQDMIFKETGLLTADRAIPLFLQIVEGVKYAHQMGITHRDIKPSNILINQFHQAKITDFGIAKIAGDKSHTKTGTKIGTLYYMSPEQVLGKIADQRSDIYALGLTLYVMLTGKMPLADDDLSEFMIMEMIVKSDLPDPRTFYPHIPEYYVKVIQQALEKDPNRRFQSCDALIQALQISPESATKPEPVIDLVPPAPENPPQPLEKPKKTKAKKQNSTLKSQPSAQEQDSEVTISESEPLGHKQTESVGKSLGCLVLLALILVGGWWYWQHHKKMKEKEYAQELASRFIYPVQSDDGRWGFEDQNGKIVINPQYEDAQPFVEGLARVKLNNRYGFVDKKGDWVIPAIYEEAAKQFSEGLVAVKVNRLWGFINPSGQMIIQPIFEGAFSFKQGRAIVIMNKKRGFIDRNGNWIVQPVFEEANYFSEGLAKCKYNGRHGYINLNGEVVIPFKYENALRFENGLAPVAIQTYDLFLGKYAIHYGYINPNDQVIIDFHYDDARQFSEGYAFAKKNNTWYMIQSDRILYEFPPYVKDVWGFKEGMLRFYSDQGYNFFNSNFQVISGQWFEDAMDFYQGKAQVKIYGRWRLIDRNGQFTTQWKTR